MSFDIGICVAVAGLIKVSRNYSVIAKDIEMDAILAVALGGNALSGSNRQSALMLGINVKKTRFYPSLSAVSGILSARCLACSP